MSLSFSMLNRNDGVGSGNQEWRVNCDTKSVKHGSRVLVLVEKKGAEGIASGTVALVEPTTSKKRFINGEVNRTQPQTFSNSAIRVVCLVASSTKTKALGYRLPMNGLFIVSFILSDS